jgi:hypothetical protein
MIVPDEIWDIIKSYLFRKNDINRRLFIKQMNLERSYFLQKYREEKRKMKMIMLIDKIMENYVEL